MSFKKILSLQGYAVKASKDIYPNMFNEILEKIKGKSRYLYFHLMGEPTLHPRLSEFIVLARGNGFLPVITTNGSLLKEKGDNLLASRPYKVSISLHSPGGNSGFNIENYYENCINFSKNAAKQGCYVALRLWNLGSDVDNSNVLNILHNEFPDPWLDIRGGRSQRIADKIFLEWGEQFDWPDHSLCECDIDADMFCYGLRDQIGIHVDGTVVPCCLDADANLALGNIFKEDFDSIISSSKAKAIYDGFTRRRAVESFCRKCGYAKRFSK